MDELIQKCHQASRANGWWDEDWNLGDKIALIHSELSKALEADKKDRTANRSWQQLANMASIPEGGFFKGMFEHHIKDTVEDELADTVIRIFDLCGKLGIPLADHIELKLRYNSLNGDKS